MVRVKWLGHSAILLEGGINIIIDPFITGNENVDITLEDLPEIDLILVTHGHKDHLGDALEISEKNDSPIVAIYELGVWLEEQGGKVIPMNYGGTIEYQGAKVSMVPAIHSGNVVEDKIYPTGPASGFVIELDYKRFYHSGDTMVFSDMVLIPEIFGPIDVSFLPIGGRFTMDIKQAAMAARYVNSKIVVPIHYNTWDIIETDPRELKKLLEDSGIEVKILNPGESFEI